MTTRENGVTARNEMFFRLAWVEDEKNPHTFGDKYPSLQDARNAAPEINQTRSARGLKPCNRVVQLKLRRQHRWPYGRYVAGEHFPLEDSTPG